jgi:hypothetical protein
MHLESAARPTVSINGTIESSRVFERAAFGNRHSKIGEETGSFQQPAAKASPKRNRSAVKTYMRCKGSPFRRRQP